MKKLKKTIKKEPMVKLNLTIDPEFYELLRLNASSEYSRVSTWTKQYLMRNLHKNDSTKNLTKNETV
jgi:hypothetical protein